MFAWPEGACRHPAFPATSWSVPLTDLFREIDEDIRRDRLNSLWEKYGIYVVGLAVGIVLVAGLIVGGRAWERSRDEAASARYNEVLLKAASEKPGEAAATFAAFAKEARPGYATLAGLRQAALLVEADDTKGAVAVYDAIAANSAASDVLRGMARIKAALLLVDELSYDDLRARIGDLDDAGSAWRGNARELLGLAAWKSGKYAEAAPYFDAIVKDNESSAGLRDRAHVMQAVLAPHLPRPETKASDTDKTAETSKTAPAGAAAQPKAE